MIEAVGSSVAKGVPRGDRAVEWLLGGLLLLHAALVGAQVVVSIATHRDLTYPESAVVWSARQAAYGLPVYEDWREWPHRFTPYGPALYYPVGWLARLTGGSALGFHYYAIGRAQALLGLGGVLAMCVALARRLGCGWGAALSCGVGLPALWPWLMQYVASYRPDAPQVFFAMLAVWLALGGLDGRRRRAAVLGCLLAAMAYKHGAVAASLVVLWLAWRGLGWRPTLVWGGGFIATLLLAGAALHVATGGMFTLNVVLGLDNGFAVPPFIRDAAGQGAPFWIDPVARLLLVPAVGVWLWWRRRDDREGALGLWLIAAWLWTAAISFKAGADVNYLLEVYALSAVAAAVVYRRLKGEARGARSARRVAGLGIAAGLVLMLVAPGLRHARRDVVRALRSARAEYPIARLSRQPPGSLLMDAAWLNPAPDARAIADPVHYVIMVNRGHTAGGPLRERLARRAFPVVLLSPVAQHAFYESADGDWIRPLLERGYVGRALGPYHIWSRRPAAD